MDVMYYTYLICCIPTNQFYYGVSYRKGAHPTQLWNTYFTSSRIVKCLIEEYGKAAFSYVIRRTFDSQDSARQWETKVLRRMRVVKRNEWLNRTDSHSFQPIYGEKNTMKTDVSKQRLSASQDILAQEQGFESYSDMRKHINPAKNKESAEKIGAWKRGKIWVKCSTGARMIDPSELDNYISLGYIRGRVGVPCSEARRQKLRDHQAALREAR